MKVIHLISGGDTGGAKTHVHSLLHGLDGKVDLTMVCFMEGPFAQEARELGIPTVVLPGHNIFRVFSKLKHMVREGNYDIIHCHGARGNMMGALLRRTTGLPVITTVHSDYRLDYLGRAFSRLTYGTINTVSLRMLDYRIGVSDAMVDLLISRGFDPNKLFSIYNGLDFTVRSPAMDRTEFFRSVGLDTDENSIVIGIAARLNPVKDIPTLIRAFAIAHAERPELRLLIAGDGDQMKELKALASSLGVQNEVCFAGWLSDVDSFYHAIDINTLTSLSETFPYSLTEGARAALPTIASRVGGVPYLIDHGANGLLFEAGNAEALAAHMVTLSADPDLRQRLGRNLYKKAKETYSLDVTVNRQIEIYDAVLRRERCSGSARNGILVCGAYGRGNAGDDAILEAILTELRQIDQDAPIWVLSRKPKRTRLAYRVNSIYAFAPIKWFYRMGRTKLYINGGGSLMQDVTSRRSLWFYLLTIWCAKNRKNKVLMYGCGIGPVLRPSNRKLTARVLQSCVDAITLRDAHSKAELDDMRVTAPQIVLSADPTVILPPAAPEIIDGLMESRGLDPNGRYIGLSLRSWRGYPDKAPLFGALADLAWEKYGLTPVFLSIEPKLDTPAAQLAAAHIKKAPYHIIEHNGSSAYTIGLFSRMQVVVSMRLHALVFAAGQQVPVVGVVYDQKVSSFLSYIGQDLYCGLNDVSMETLSSYLDAAYQRIEDTEFLRGCVTRLLSVEAHNSQIAQRLYGGESV